MDMRRRVQRSKPAKGVTMRTRRANLRFTQDLDAMGGVLKVYSGKNYTCERGELKTVGGWRPVTNDKGQYYTLSNINPLEVGSMRVDVGNGKYQELCYIYTVAGGFLHYQPNTHTYYAVAANRGRTVVQPVMGRDGTVLAVFTDKGFLIGGISTAVETVIAENTLAAGAYFKHRIFVAMKGGEVRYSAPENFYNFEESPDEGGRIRFSNHGGEIVAMHVYDDALYIFFENGIMRLQASGEPSRFYAEQLDYAGGGILRRTICTCQNALYFMSLSGVYRVVGRRVERLPIEGLIPEKETGLEGGAVFEGRMIFRFCPSEGEAYKTVLLTADGRTYTEMNDLLGLGNFANGRVAFVDGAQRIAELSRLGKLQFDPIADVMETDFGFAGKKFLTKIHLQGEGTGALDIYCDGRCWSHSIVFENGGASIGMKLHGDIFAFTFSLSKNARIVGMQVEYKTRR